MIEFLDILLGWPDLVVLVVLIALDAWIVARRIRLPSFAAVVGVPLFLVVLPLGSMMIEIDRFSADHRGMLTDGFELLYTWLRFPEYWVLGLGQLGLFLWSRRGEEDIPEASLPAE